MRAHHRELTQNAATDIVHDSWSQDYILVGRGARALEPKSKGASFDNEIAKVVWSSWLC